MRAVDTNVLLRVFTRDNAAQTAISDLYIQRGAWVSVLVLAEAVWVLSTVYERNRNQLGNLVEEILQQNTSSYRMPLWSPLLSTGSDPSRPYDLNPSHSTKTEYDFNVLGGVQDEEG